MRRLSPFVKGIKESIEGQLGDIIHQIFAEPSPLLCILKNTLPLSLTTGKRAGGSQGALPWTKKLGSSRLTILKVPQWLPTYRPDRRERPATQTEA